jgi:hypothetical protein
MKSAFLQAALSLALSYSATPASAHLVQSVQSPPSCPTPSHCIGGGDLLANGATSNPARIVYASAPKQDEKAESNDVPEPGTLALMGIGAIAVGCISRRYGAKRA